MTFLPGTAISIDGKPFVVERIHVHEFYTVKAPRLRRVKLWRVADGTWRYGVSGKHVNVTWLECDGCGRALLAYEKNRCDDCVKMDAAIAEGAL